MKNWSLVFDSAIVVYFAVRSIIWRERERERERENFLFLFIVGEYFFVCVLWCCFVLFMFRVIFLACLCIVRKSVLKVPCVAFIKEYRLRV